MEGLDCRGCRTLPEGPRGRGEEVAVAELLVKDLELATIRGSPKSVSPLRGGGVTFSLSLPYRLPPRGRG